jgi:prophage antirepressor-like protein
MVDECGVPSSLNGLRAKPFKDTRGTRHSQMDSIQVYAVNEEKHDVHVIWEDEQPLFRAIDVANVLGLSSVHSTIRSYDDCEKVICKRRDERHSAYLTNVGVIHMLCRTRKPGADVFLKWMMKLIRSMHMQRRIEIIKQRDQQHHQAMLSAYDGRGRYLYIAKIRDELDDTMLIKIGSSNNIRLHSRKQNEVYGSFSLLHLYNCAMNKDFKMYLQNHSTMLPLAYKNVIHNGRRSKYEVFLMTKEELNILVVIIGRNWYRFTRPNNVQDESVEENMDDTEDTEDTEETQDAQDPQDTPDT